MHGHISSHRTLCCFCLFVFASHSVVLCCAVHVVCYVVCVHLGASLLVHKRRSQCLSMLVSECMRVCMSHYVCLSACQGADDNATIRFDLPSGHKHWEVNSAIFRRYCVRALPDAVLTSHDSSRVIRRDLDTGAPLYEFQLKSWNLCISADERVFVTSDNSNAVCLVDLETGQGLRKWSSKVNSRYSICYAVVAGPTVLWTTKDKLSIRYRCKT